MEGSARIRALRKQLSLTQQALADAVGVTRSAVISWEKGTYFPEGENLSNLATVLETSTDYLLGKTTDPTPASSKPQKKPGPMGPDLKHNIISMDNWIRIPVLSINTAACAGAGNGLCGIDLEASEYIMVDPDLIGPIDDQHKPFGIHVDGDSMEGANIPDGSIAVINPAIQVLNGAAALVVFDDRWAIKWVLWKKDGSVELRSANPSYAPIPIESELAADDSWFKVVGPVMAVVRHTTPRGMF